MIIEPDFACFGHFHDIPPLAKMFDNGTMPRLFYDVQSVSAIISFSLIVGSFSIHQSKRPATQPEGQQALTFI